MRRSLTLIELIFSMVIIAIAFTVLPKMMQLAARTSIASIKEEALYNAVAYMGLIKSMAWDESNTLYDDILLVESGDSAYECNQSTGYRVGGFRGSRNCAHHQRASSLGLDSGDDNVYDDIDDFEDKNASNAARGGTRGFDLNVSVRYVGDPDPSIEATEMNSSDSATATTNTKYVEINITTANARYGANNGGRISLGRIYYFGYNIGQIKINRYPWQ